MARGLKFNVRFLDRKIYRSLSLLRAAAADMEPLLDGWGGILEASTRSRFDSGRGPGGVPWKPSKRVLAHGGKTLVDDNNLERSIRYEVQGGHRLLVGVDGRSESAKHAASHQFGVDRTVVVVRHERVIDQAFGVPLREAVVQRVRGHARKMRLPARPFLGIDNNDRREMRRAAQDYYRELVGK